MTENQVQSRSLFEILNRLAPGVAVAGVMSFTAVAILGLGKDDGSWASDFYWYFAGGQCFLNGSSMYAVECVGPILKKLYNFSPIAGLSYPPHFAPFTLLAYLLPVNLAAWLFFVINIAASIAVALVAAKIATQYSRQHQNGSQLSHLWIVLLVFGSSGLWAAIWLGQVTVLVALCIWLSFQKIEQGRIFSAAVLLALASVKPQMVALVFFWLLLNGQFRILVVAAVVAGILSIYTFMQMGIQPAIESWLYSLSTYQKYPVNQLGNNTIMGIPSFLALYGMTIPIWASMGFGAIVLVILRINCSILPFSPLALVQFYCCK